MSGKTCTKRATTVGCFMMLCVCVNLCVCVLSGGRCRLQQSGGGAGGDHVLVGRVGQVDGLHSHLWRRSDDAGETLPQTEVSPSVCEGKQTRKDNKTSVASKASELVFAIAFHLLKTSKISTETVNKFLYGHNVARDKQVCNYHEPVSVL